MTSNTLSDGVYTDFKGLTQLRFKAATDSPKALQEVGKQFEALFIQMMLQSMRQASPGDPLFGGKEQALYRDLFDKQISMNMAEKSKLGLADLIVNQLRHGVQPKISSSSGTALYRSQSISTSNQVAKNSETVSGSENKEAYLSPSAFVKKIWPYAQRAAEQLHVDPQLLVAQAALETGWGRGIIRHPDGRSSNNYFGIKAGASWGGETASVTTLEYRDGVAVKERVPFRSYDSLSESFQDYVQFLKSNPRYEDALAHADNPSQYANALQNAGYATDPYYSEKIRNVLGGDTLTSAMTDLNLSGAGPIG